MKYLIFVMIILFSSSVLAVGEADCSQTYSTTGLDQTECQGWCHFQCSNGNSECSLGTSTVSGSTCQCTCKINCESPCSCKLNVMGNCDVDEEECHTDRSKDGCLTDYLCCKKTTTSTGSEFSNYIAVIAIIVIIVAAFLLIRKK